MDSTIKKICAGDVRTASRLIRDIEDKLPDAKAKIKKLYAHTGKSFIIGITGAPGAGKSTLTDALISEFRKMNKTVGVLAVDPTSPFTGGAILETESACSAMPRMTEFSSGRSPPAAHWEDFRRLPVTPFM